MVCELELVFTTVRMLSEIDQYICTVRTLACTTSSLITCVGLLSYVINVEVKCVYIVCVCCLL